MLEHLKRPPVYLALFLTSVILCLVYYSLSKGDGGVSPKGDAEYLYTTIATLAGAITTLVASISGALMKWLDLKKANIELKMKKLEFEEAKKKASQEQSEN